MATLSDAWFGKDISIGFAKKNQKPASPYNDRWLEGNITNFSESGGAREQENIPFFAGATKSYQKPQEQIEVTVELIPTNSDFDKMVLGNDEWVADNFDSYTDDAAVLAAWVPNSGASDASDVDLESTYYKTGRQSAELNWGTYSNGNALFEMDVSSVHGAVKDIDSIVGTPGNDTTPTQGVITFQYYIDDTDALAELDTNGIEIRIGSSSGNYMGWYVLKSKLTNSAGWNFCIVDLATTEDTNVGAIDWSSIDYVAINLDLAAGATGDTAFIDDIRIYDSDLTSAMTTDQWRIQLLAQTNSSASSGEKLRWVFEDCNGVSLEPDFDADGHLKATLTFNLSATDDAGLANIRKEWTSDASERALTTLGNY